MIPKDPAILLSYVNTQLRDYYSTFSEMCKSLDLSSEDIIETLGQIQYEYDSETNQFI